MIERNYEGELTGRIGDLQREIVKCRACPRLVEHRERKALHERRSSFSDWDYWGAPVPSNGDPEARLLVVGLAPAAHGANRTGRMFTGDPTANFLIRAMHKAGLANQPTSEHREDGLKLLDSYAIGVGRCAPPGDRPTPAELANCRRFVTGEIRLLGNVQAVLALGRIAFDHFLRAISEASGSRLRADFSHGLVHNLGIGLPTVFASYHPSPRNTNTGRLTERDLDRVMNSIRSFLDRS